MRYLLCGGGTGGHINPALAIADEIKEKDSEAVIEFGGGSAGMETRLVPRAGYKLNTVEIYGLKRRITVKNIKVLVKAVTSVSKAKKIIKSFRPDVVVGTGGYASWPFVRAAAALGVKTLIQEQNVFPGVTTKKLSRYVDRICISFDASRSQFDENRRDKLVLTGNPIKPCTVSRTDARRQLGLGANDVYVLSCGGSLGADKFNEYCIDAMNIYKTKPAIKQIHAVGRGGWEKYSAIVSEKGLDKHTNYEIVDYIYDMPVRMAAADIVISRVGAITVSELACIGRATVFIPSPNVTEDHQYKNAVVLKDAGAAEVYRECDVNAEILAKTVSELASDPARRAEMAEKFKRFAKPDAAKEIAAQVIELARMTAAK